MDKDSYDFETRLKQARTIKLLYQAMFGSIEGQEESKPAPDDIISCAYREIIDAAKAQREGKPAPEMMVIPLILLNLITDKDDHNILPREVWCELIYLLLGGYVTKKRGRGRPGKKAEDEVTAKAYEQCYAKGVKGPIVIAALGEARGFLGDPANVERSVWRAIKRGRELDRKEKHSRLRARLNPPTVQDHAPARIPVGLACLGLVGERIRKDSNLTLANI